jgi:hypothetical protein
MSTRNHRRDGAPRLQVTALGALHLAVDGRRLCGRVRIDEPDIYSDDAGLAVWNDGPLARCGKCSAALAARVRQPPLTAEARR